MAAPEKPGLQLQRTQLSWERSAVGLLAVAGTLLVHRNETLTWDRTVLAAVAVSLAVLVIWTSRRRGHSRPHTDTAGRTTLPEFGWQIQLIGWSTGALAFIIAIMVLLD